MEGAKMGKKIILLFIDSFMPDVFAEARRKGLVPSLDFLRKHGGYWPECVTVFPTMSATVDGSLFTGTYPDVHKLPGIVWYNRNENKVVNYINGLAGILKLGLTRCTDDIAFKLNEVHFSKKVKTVFELLEEKGLATASVNCILHRGPHRYEFRVPGLLNLALFRLNVPFIQGPKMFSMGKFARTPLVEGVKWKWNQSAFKKYGLNDSFAIDLVKKMVQEKQLPALTVVYLPDNDYAYHRHPDQGPEILGKVDKEIGRLLQSFGSKERAVEESIFIVTGDHGQARNGFDSEATVDLEPLLQGLKLANLKKVDPQRDELVVCNNERMTYLYPLQEGILEKAVERLTSDPRIDIVAWKEKNGVRIQNKRNSLFFAPGDGRLDPYGRPWQVEGDPLFDLTVTENTVSSREYPDLFSRLFGGLYAHEGQVITATTYPGYEFYSKGDPLHLGGASHGSLHRIDSIVPLLITGEKEDSFHMPRLVDLKDYILKKFED